MSMDDRISAADANLRQTRGSSAQLGVQPVPGLEVQKRKKRGGGVEDTIDEVEEGGGGQETNKVGGGQVGNGSGGQRANPQLMQVGGDQGQKGLMDSDDDHESYKPGADKGKGPGGEESEGDELASKSLGKGILY
ncbi:uncharacterized protein MELLADRAFT_59594 [Melampsora larici-populina 98AG31]|uniref:Uncharacterized protein n=1 Tax=Melampsora larici-populina (strain 98AG31 / pathotype 3-4-7) TaxID=747676 RepID=F4R834_MELLP|nr:uncharacterized protein MELLADRAFT_59594 [Melampsora larici-populina 98AG31]EGG11686.1 hypothetical protein MELLADRAFT_59594 [Melampsora larici-populina 98AG31]